jgi:hypothetical protein
MPNFRVSGFGFHSRASFCASAICAGAATRILEKRKAAAHGAPVAKSAILNAPYNSFIIRKTRARESTMKNHGDEPWHYHASPLTRGIKVRRIMS